MALLASHGGYLVSDLPEHCSPNPLQFYPAEMPGGKDNYSDDSGINAIRRLTLVFLGHRHRVELIAKFGAGEFCFSIFSTITFKLSYLHFFCIPEKDRFLGCHSILWKLFPCLLWGFGYLALVLFVTFLSNFDHHCMHHKIPLWHTC